MKNVPAVATAIRTKHNVTATPRAVIEWNMNRYLDVTVSNALSEVTDGNDVDLYPLDSIVQSWRPTKGINKARVGYAYVGSTYNDYPTARFYVASQKDKYKYWMSPTPSDGTRALANCTPTVVYGSRVRVNKLRAVVENTWASPENMVMQFTTDGSTWTTAATNPTVAANGVIEVFWNGAAWSSTKPTTLLNPPTVEIMGVRLVVTTLRGGMLADGSITQTRVSGVMTNTTGAGSYLSLIELTACLVVDVSDRLISVEDTFDSGDVDVVTPIGTVTSNTGAITLWNADAQFSTENTASIYKNLIEKNAEVTVSYVYTVAGTRYEVPQFKMYTDAWEESSDGTISAQVSDASKYLSEVKPNPCKYENMKFTEIMYRLCDSVGFNSFNVSATSRSRDFRVPVFWTDGSKTLWEILDDLARASQSLVFFDENGMLNIKTRGDAFSASAAPVWTLRGLTSGTELADIEELTADGEFGTNTAKVTYRDTQWADVNNGFAENTIVWEADDPTVLRSCPLIKSLEVGATRFYMSGADAAVWPYTGMVVIEGEVIEYEGKVFNWQNAAGAWNSSVVKTQSEFDDLNTQTQYTKRQWNHFSGEFRIKTRGLWNTAETRHSPDFEGYTITRFAKGGTYSGGAVHHNKRDSTVSINTSGFFDEAREYLTVTRGVPGDSPWRYIGTSLAFLSGTAQHQAGGIVFNMGSGKDGYYVELCPSSQINEKDRAVRNEAVFYVIKNGNRSPNMPVKGADAPVAMDGWGELDVWTNREGTSVSVYYRGKKIHSVSVPGEWQLSPSGKFGMFARGSSMINFSYLYASSRMADPEPTNDYSSFHRVLGVTTGKDFVEEWKHRNTKRERQKRNKTNKSVFDKRQRFMDEFGPYIHELKEFEVKFDPAPVLSSYLYSTNNWSAYLIDYSSNSFGARFTMVNTERFNSVLSGDDTLIYYGTDGAVVQHLSVLGRALVIGEGEEIVVRNEQMVRARGEIVTEINSDWIQSKEAAKEIGEWIVNHWGKGADQLSVSIFGNPLLQVGDVVAVEYPEKKMFASTHVYFVTGASSSFDEGFSTNLTLRRRN